jgi:phenylalanyl-tRNA synthetase beta chain
MLQVSSYHLVTKEDLKKLGIKSEIEVENSRTDYSILRPNLVCQTLKILSENVDKEYPQKIFEIGKIFSIDHKEETEIKETEKLCLALVPSNFTEAKQILEYIGRMLNVSLIIEPAENPLLISGRAGKVQYNGKSIGGIGELHPNLLKKFHLKLPATIIEISLEEILKDKI